MATMTFSMASVPLTGSKAFTGTDADMQNLLNWAAVAYAPLVQQLFNPTNATGFVPTNAQLGIALATGTMNAWKTAVQQFMQSPPPPPPSQMTFA